MNSRLREIEHLHLGLLALATCVAWLSGRLAPASVLLGGAVMLINLRLLAALVARLLTPTAAARPATVVALMLAKLGVFIAAIAVVVWRLPIDVAGFALGATTLLVAITLSSLRAPTPAHP
ncbi:MAG: hypothetical protein SF182_10005 [Deltaproteobacteria bacterium]|nr:hypothetical protein [Deltaproteobacteria bacterium]